MPLSTVRPAALASSVTGSMPTPTTSRSHATGSLSATLEDAAVAVTLDARQRCAQAQVDAVLAVQLGEDRRHLGAEHAQQRLLERLDEGDLGVGVAGGGGDLETDPAAADDADPGARRSAPP